jgi:hypothetical protein
MRFLVKATIPVEAGNDLLRDPNFGTRLQQILGDIGPEAAYFTAQDGQRTIYLIVNMEGAHELPRVAEPLWLALEADVDRVPVMDQADMVKATPSIEQAAKTYT